MITSKKVINKLEDIAPKKLAEEWDNVGLQIGSLNKKIKKVLLALDINIDVVEEAIENQVDMIISHHPMFFDPIKTIDLDTYKGQMIEKIIKNDIVVYSAHTNLDLSKDGVNDALAETLEIENSQILVTEYREAMYKLSVFVPVTHENKIRKVLGDAGAGGIGNYSYCTFTSKGIGTFKPNEGSNPYIGNIEELEKVDEVKIEVIVSGDILDDVVKKMIYNHPYEEVAYDIFKLENQYIEYGIGRVGNINKTTLINFAKKVKEKLNSAYLRIYGNINEEVEKIAVVGGSGSDFIKDAKKANVDVYITGDIKHHDAQQAMEWGLNLIDAGHFSTEKIVMNKLEKYFRKEFSTDIEILISEKDNSGKYLSI
ncbi:Nif3-like dinuclear metal center hexameric protein [Clostridium sp. D2Q-14]|uniref:Nif3-like dinuclear metal center hexameric protein n=1 Tax=Anaeromonas gelatinilytica TaxID=2683194 RepID=UPI00193B860E|nr:Nif3-like dinuclear metal center hexameric protein [Anaeromonas gelatinilytica]